MIILQKGKRKRKRRNSFCKIPFSLIEGLRFSCNSVLLEVLIGAKFFFLLTFKIKIIIITTIIKIIIINATKTKLKTTLTVIAALLAFGFVFGFGFDLINEEVIGSWEEDFNWVDSSIILLSWIDFMDEEIGIEDDEEKSLLYLLSSKSKLFETYPNGGIE